MPRSENGHWIVPIDSDGNYRSYDYSFTTPIEGKPFIAELKYHSYSKSAHTIHYTLIDAQGVKYPMFLTTFHDYLKFNSHCIHWTFDKRGQSYGIVPYNGVIKNE